MYLSMLPSWSVNKPTRRLSADIGMPPAIREKKSICILRCSPRQSTPSKRAWRKVNQATGGNSALGRAKLLGDSGPMLAPRARKVLCLTQPQSKSDISSSFHTRTSEIRLSNMRELDTALCEWCRNLFRLAGPSPQPNLKLSPKADDYLPRKECCIWKPEAQVIPTRDCSDSETLLWPSVLAWDIR